MIEKAIRSAFQKGDPSDQAFREKVYRQAFAALDRVLQANPGVTVEAAMNRRKALQAQIVEIEQEYLPRPPGTEARVSAPPPVAPSVELDTGKAEPASTPAVELQHAVEKTPQAVDSVVSDSPSADPPPVSANPELPGSELPGLVPERQAVSGQVAAPKRRNRFARLFVAATLLSALAIGIWWAVQTGLIGGAAPLPAETVQPEAPEDFEPGADQPPVQPAQAAADRDWIPVFSPTDADAISAPSDATAEMMKNGDGDFVRIRSGKTGSAVLFDIGQGVLEQIAGKKATFDVVARAEDGKDTQMSVICNFGELGDCGRKRYAVGNAKGDYLFELDVPDKKPGAGGTIAINSDFDNAGKSVDIYEIRVSVEE